MPDNGRPVERCSACWRLWQGTRQGIYHDELRQQDGHGPEKVPVSVCCGRVVGKFHGVRPVQTNAR